jgi:hypothetical protein
VVARLIAELIDDHRTVAAAVRGWLGIKQVTDARSPKG